MKKFFCFIFCVFMCRNSFSTEIIENISKQEDKFGDWVVVCEEDEMMDKTNCKIFSEFYENSFIYVQPNNKVANQFVIMVPTAKNGTTLKFKVDKNALIVSDNIAKNDAYGIIPFSPVNQKTMLNQIKSGENLYLRFTVNDPKGLNGEKEMTAKISLAEFSKLLTHYNIKMGNAVSK